MKIEIFKAIITSFEKKRKKWVWTRSNKLVIKIFENQLLTRTKFLRKNIFLTKCTELIMISKITTKFSLFFKYL